MSWMWRLKEINPAFKATLFAIPGRGDEDFWANHPDWIELAVHGWRHETVDECIEWDYERTVKAIYARPQGFTYGFKAPGWQISDATYAALKDYGWWVADQHLEDGRRPPELPTYFYEDSPDRLHLHVQNVCGNGLEESWDELSERVRNAEHFQFCSDVLTTTNTLRRGDAL